MTAARETASFLDGLFSLSGKVAVVTGATGVLGGAMARGLSRAGGRVGVLGRREERAVRRPCPFPTLICIASKELSCRCGIKHCIN